MALTHMIINRLQKNWEKYDLGLYNDNEKHMHTFGGGGDRET